RMEHDVTTSQCPMNDTQIRPITITRFFALGAAALLLCAAPSRLQAQETADFFKQNCMSCHTIGGGRLTGPDLKNVSQRKDRDWLIKFMLDPKGVIDSGDPYAQQLLKESRGVVMPAIPLMTRERAGYLLDLIDAE